MCNYQLYSRDCNGLTTATHALRVETGITETAAEKKGREKAELARVERQKRGTQHKAAHAAADPNGSKRLFRMNNHKDAEDKEQLRQKEQKMADKGLPCDHSELEDF